MLSRSHVSSMTGGYTCPIYYRGVLSIEKESMIIRYKLAELIKKVLRPEPFSRSQVSSMPMVGRRTMLSRSHVSSMTGRCTCPISYRGVFSIEKESMIIRYNLAELIKKFLSRGTPLSRSHVSSMPYGGESNLALLPHVSSMTGGCTCPIYYRGVVSIEKASMIIRYKLAELTKKVS